MYRVDYHRFINYKCARLIELKINGKLYPSTTGIINVGHLDKKYDIRATVKREDSPLTDRPECLICSRRRSYIPATVTIILAFIELLAASQAIPDHIFRSTEKAYQ